MVEEGDLPLVIRLIVEKPVIDDATPGNKLKLLTFFNSVIFPALAVPPKKVMTGRNQKMCHLHRAFAHAQDLSKNPATAKTNDFAFPLDERPRAVALTAAALLPGPLFAQQDWSPSDVELRNRGSDGVENCQLQEGG